MLAFNAISLARRILTAIAIFAQVVSFTSVHAQPQTDEQVVICTAMGAHSVSWSELTGEPSPFDDGGESSVHAYCTFCLVFAQVAPEDYRSGIERPQPLFQHLNYPTPRESAACHQHAAGPPLPSRSPPSSQS
ncbi:MAG: hypothetical protein AAGC77_08425 [Pseudomonadota bacterium]